MATQGCPCGFLGSPRRACRCGPPAIARYRGRLSGPLLDRIDVHLGIGPVSARDLSAGARSLFGEETRAARERVRAARARQEERALRLGVARVNARLAVAELERAAPIDGPARALLSGAVEKLGLSARGYHRARRLARTLADLAGEEAVGASAIAEALTLREERKPLPSASRAD